MDVDVLKLYYVYCMAKQRIKSVKVGSYSSHYERRETKKNGIGESKEESCGLDWNESYQYEFVISYTYLYI